MKKLFIVSILFFSFSICSCNPVDKVDENFSTEIPDTDNNSNENTEKEEEEQSIPSDNIENMKLKITIGKNTITATFEDNPTARDFITLLPFTVKLQDYNNTEKIFSSPRKLSTENAPRGTDPDLGDIAYYSPWGNMCIFYKDFGYSTGLIRIARIDSGVSNFQVSGDIESVHFELIENN